MESNFNNRDFEQFVKQNADQYRMFPSEQVWKGIYSTLHTRRKWYGIGLTFLILTIASVTWVMLSPSDKKQLPSVEPTIASEINTLVSQKSDQKETLNIASAKPNTNSSPFVSGINNWQKREVSIENNLTITNPVLRDQLIAENVIAEKEMASQKVIISSNTKGPALTSTAYNFINTESLIDDNLSYYTDRNKQNLYVDNLTTAINDGYPLSIENVINSFSVPNNRKKLLWQIYFMPTVSYRKLVENKASIVSSSSSPFNYSAIYGVNNAVTHKPDMGFELGFNAAYPIGKNIRITSGLQFNVSKYDIWAYNHSTEFATVALTSGGGSSSVSTTTNYRNFDGYKPNWLHNLYLSASLPIGAELRLSGNTQNYIGIGGTLQPTYILGDRAYLISTDYKNYVKIPQLIRKWNVNTSFEAFAAYSTGKINWKIGPQVRYQLLSSFQEKYPIKEHLFDFGLKVGIMLNK